MKQDIYPENNKIYRQLPVSDTDKRDNEEIGDVGKNYLARMKPQGGCRIHLGVDMVDTVEAPQKRYPVVHPVPGVHPEVEKDKYQDRFPCRWEG